jgi:hypothetical protein
MNTPGNPRRQSNDMRQLRRPYSEPSTVWTSRHFSFRKSLRSETATCLCWFRPGPGGIEREYRSICLRNSTSSARV